jgi:hypothetical protein
MSNTSARQFDLNIEKILEGWERHHAIRELIANALDEQALTGTREAQISKDRNGWWHIRDFGRGLRHTHLTQKENQEKLRKSEKVVGKFGVGLKDALATLNRRGAKVRISSQYGLITLRVAPKHGFGDVHTLHAIISEPDDPGLTGTDIALSGVSSSDVAAAKAFFFKFSNERILEQTPYGHILSRPETSGAARIYVKGLLVAEEKNFVFSYNITALTASMNRALNRERTNVGRTAYADRVKAMLLASRSDAVAEVLAQDLIKLEKGTSHDEVLWLEVAVHACQILNAARKVVFVTATERTLFASALDDAISEGYQIVTVPENVRTRLKGVKDFQGNSVRDLNVYQQEWAQSFEFKFVDDNELSAREKAVFERRNEIAELAGGLPRTVKQIRISETMRPDFGSAYQPVGLWEPDRRRIIIKRSELRSAAAFAGALLHEMTHASTGLPDVTREFEGALTATLGNVSVRALVPATGTKTLIKP